MTKVPSTRTPSADASPAAREPMLLLVRHGRAEGNHPDGDAKRSLTPDGRTQFAASAAALAARVPELDMVVASPYLRTLQTAGILARAVGADGIQEAGQLGAAVAEADELVAMARRLGTGVAIVGHNPSIAEAVARLSGAGALEVPFAPGTIAAFGLAGDRLVLRWVILPGGRVVDADDGVFPGA